DGSGEADGIEHGAAADYHDIATPIQSLGLEGLEHSLKQVDIVLDRLPAGDDLDDSCLDQEAWVVADQGIESRGKIGPGLREVLIEPELHPGRSGPGGFKHIDQNTLIFAEDIIGEA